MPTLFRFLSILAVAAALIYGAMFALAVLVKPNKGEISERIPAERLERLRRPADGG